MSKHAVVSFTFEYTDRVKTTIVSDLYYGHQQWLSLFLNLPSQFSFCSKSKEGNQTLYRKVTGDDGVLICVKKSGQYLWKFLDGKI